MFQQVSIQSLIEERVPFRWLSTGWFAGKCALCNDYKERAGFRFDDNKVVYHCWNCSRTNTYEEFSGRMSKGMREVLRAYGFDDSDISSNVNIPFFNKKNEEEKTISLATITKIKTTTPTIELPPKCFPIGHSEFLEYQEKLVTYLLDRKIDINKYPFFFSLEQRYLNRVIIPFYRNGKLIYWQARHIDNSVKMRYDNAQVPREAILFNFDKLSAYSPAPLFVTEGVFDAMMIDGVALMGSALNPAKEKLLSESPRRLIFVIDKDSNGRALAERVLEMGWEIAFSPQGTEDLNHSVQRFNMSWTISELMKSIRSKGDAADLLMNLHCPHEQPKTRSRDKSN
jgi:hypothetical protein